MNNNLLSGMTPEFKILIVEDIISDAELIANQLRQVDMPLTSKRIDSQDDFVHALNDFNPDIIVSDSSLLQFSAKDALRILAEKNKNIPFVLVSGKLGDEETFELLKLGAQDFISRENPDRLSDSVKKILNDINKMRLKTQSEKLEALSLLSGSIVHDFNNFLTAISGFSDLLRRRMDEKDPRRFEVEGISDAVERATSFAQKLLLFSQNRMSKHVVVDLNQVVARMASSLESATSDRIVIEVKKSSDPLPVQCEEKEIEDIITNIWSNACDAMPNGGSLTIETSLAVDSLQPVTHKPESVLQKEKEAPSASIAKTVDNSDAVEGNTGDRSNRFVQLRISDTGDGMDNETLGRMFEPYFTRKKKGGYSGLGMSTVYGIVKKAGGHIDVTSRLGRGTIIKILLNETSERRGIIKKRKDDPVPNVFTKRKGNVLLVEDDESVRAIAYKVLCMHGYHVMEAKNGEDAIQQFSKQNGSFEMDILVTDIVMAGVNGPDLAKIMVQKYPNIKVLYLSGYSESEVQKHLQESFDSSFLAKPFRPHKLIQKVHEILSKSRS